MSKRFGVVLLWFFLFAPVHGQFRQFAAQIVDGHDAEETLFYQSELHIFNRSATGSVAVEVRLFRNDGSALARLSTGVPEENGTAMRTFVLPPLGARNLSTLGLGGDLTEVGWALIESDGPVQVVGSLQLWRSPQVQGNLIAATAIPVQEPGQSFSSYIRIFPSSNTGLAVLNTSPEAAAEVTFQLYGASGSFLDVRTILLPPRQKIAQFLNENELFAGLSDFEGTVEISSTEPLAVVMVRLDDQYWSNLRPSPGRFGPEHGQNTQFAAQIVDGNEGTLVYDSRLHIFNRSPDFAVLVDVRLFHNEGSPMLRFPARAPRVGHGARAEFLLPPLGVRTLWTLGTATGWPTEVGWALIHSGAPVEVVGSLRLRRRQVGERTRLIAATAIPVQTPAKTFSSYARLSEFSRTGLAMVNTVQVEAAEVTFQLYDMDGEFVDEKTILLPARQKIAQFLNEGELFIELEEFEGTVEISSTQPVAAVVIRLDDEQWSNFRLFPGRLDPDAPSP